MKKKDKSVLYIAILVYLILFFGTLAYSYLKNSLISYPIDDVFIHSSIAKNFVQYQTWGVTSHGFSNTSSSLLYVLILSFGYLIFGVNMWLPFAINVFFSILLIYAIYKIYVKEKLSFTFTVISLAGLILVTPLAGISIFGMEHIMHGFFTIIFIYYLAKYLELLSEGKNTDKIFFIIILASAALVVASRYEGLFLIFTGAFLCLLKKQWKLAILIIFFGLLPISVLGLYALSQGSYFFPNSILLKRNSLDTVRNYILPNFKEIISALWPFFVVAVTISITYCFELYKRFRNRSFWKAESTTVFLFVSILIAHIAFARINKSFRYEAYLVITGIFTITIFFNKFLLNKNLKGISKKIFFLVGLVFILGGTYIRGVTLTKKIIPAIKNIHDQQYEIASFLRQYYNNGSVAANDIGAITYFTNIKILDFIGLGSIDIAKKRKSDIGELDIVYANSLVHKEEIDLIVIHDSLFKVIPDDWIKVGEWTIQNNVVCSSDKVVFYAIERSKADILRRNLEDFAIKMPWDVTVNLT